MNNKYMVKTLNRILLLAFLASSGTVLALPPQPPTNINVLAGNRSATITWSPPQDNGGSPLVSYTVFSSDGKTCSVFAKRNKCTIKKLKNLNWYTFYMVSVSNEGVSDYSEESPVIIPYKKNVNAACGTANNLFTPTEPNPNDLCMTGTATEYWDNNDTLYHWSCIGYRRGASTDCQSAPYTQPKLKVGDKGPAGGKIFYVTPDGYHGMELASPLIAAYWGCGNSYIGLSDTSIGSGEMNTRKIVSLCTEKDNNTAAQLADKFEYNGYNDWFLPSKDEMALIIGNVADRLSEYWTSNESGAYNAVAFGWNYTFLGGGQVKFNNPIVMDKLKREWASGYFDNKFFPVRKF
jgi:hypothetical protein